MYPWCTIQTILSISVKKKINKRTISQRATILCITSHWKGSTTQKVFILFFILHRTCNLNISVRYKCPNDHTTSSEKIHACLEPQKFHCRTAYCLIPLQINVSKGLNKFVCLLTYDKCLKIHLTMTYILSHTCRKDFLHHIFLFQNWFTHVFQKIHSLECGKHLKN